MRKRFFLILTFCMAFLSACNQDKDLVLYNGCRMDLMPNEKSDGRIAAYEQAFNAAGKLNIPFHKRIYSKEYELYVGLVHIPLPEHIRARDLFHDSMQVNDESALSKNARFWAKSKDRFWNCAILTSLDGQTWLLASNTADSALSYGKLHPDSLSVRFNCEEVEANQ